MRKRSLPTEDYDRIANDVIHLLKGRYYTSPDAAVKAAIKDYGCEAWHFPRIMSRVKKLLREEAIRSPLPATPINHALCARQARVRELQDLARSGNSPADD